MAKDPTFAQRNEAAESFMPNSAIVDLTHKLLSISCSLAQTHEILEVKSDMTGELAWIEMSLTRNSIPLVYQQRPHPVPLTSIERQMLIIRQRIPSSMSITCVCYPPRLSDRYRHEGWWEL